MKFLHNNYVQLALRLLLGVIFIFAALGKIAEPGKFAKEIINYQLLPIDSINIIALILPWFELLVGMGIIFGSKLKENTILALLMMIAFTVAVSIAFALGLDIDCGCFGSAHKQTVGWAKIFENLGIIAVSLLILIAKPSSKGNAS